MNLKKKVIHSHWCKQYLITSLLFVRFGLSHSTLYPTHIKCGWRKTIPLLVAMPMHTLNIQYTNDSSFILNEFIFCVYCDNSCRVAMTNVKHIHHIQCLATIRTGKWNRSYQCMNHRILFIVRCL